MTNDKYLKMYPDLSDAARDILEKQGLAHEEKLLKLFASLSHRLSKSINK